MAKVLFVVYVPSTDSDKKETEEWDQNNEINEEKAQEDCEHHEEKDDEMNEDASQDRDENEKKTEGADNVSEEIKDDKSKEVSETDNVEEEVELEKIATETENVFFKDIGKNNQTNVETTTPDTEDVYVTPPCDDVLKNDSNSDKVSESEKPTLVRFLSEEASLIEKVKGVLDNLYVTGVQWTLTEQNVFIGMFLADYGSQCEDILRKLSMLKIGVIKDSSVSVFPASISSEEKEAEEEIEQEEKRVDEFSEQVSQFKNSIKSRLVVDQVVNAVQKDAAFTFDYLMLVLLASFVALMGLLESSSVVLVASMLISPLMGPILAGVFGVVIRKQELIRVGIVNEIIGLTICVAIGFIFGFIPAGLEVANENWRSSTEWPTPEMSSRGALRSLPVGILIAVPSGAGVALSILGGKVGSLVGVAISASLLPPAVNAGLLWANAIVAAIYPPSVHNQLEIPSDVNGSELNYTYSAYNQSIMCASLVNNDYEQQYFCSLAKENVVLGCISLLLTILNIVCIILMGVIVLKIKEVAPLPQSFTPASETEFFNKDLRIARESNVTMKGQAAVTIKKEWLKKYQQMKSEIGNHHSDQESDDENELDEIIDEVESSPSVVSIFDKMLIYPIRWSRNLNIPSSKQGGGRKFDFVTPASSLFEDGENGMELRQRTAGTPVNSKKGDGDDSAAYYTVHSYIPSRDLRKRDSFYFKSGKVITKLKLPKRSRFIVAKVDEDHMETISEIAPKTSSVAASGKDQMEAQPLLLNSLP